MLCLTPAENPALEALAACPDGRMVQGFATDSSLSPTTAWLGIPAGACQKVASDFEFAVFFNGHFGFLHHLQLASYDLAGT